MRFWKKYLVLIIMVIIMATALSFMVNPVGAILGSVLFGAMIAGVSGR